MSKTYQFVIGASTELSYLVGYWRERSAGRAQKIQYTSMDRHLGPVHIEIDVQSGQGKLVVNETVVLVPNTMARVVDLVTEVISEVDDEVEYGSKFSPYRYSNEIVDQDTDWQ